MSKIDVSYEVDKGVPIPVTRIMKDGINLYRVLLGMHVGDSIMLPNSRRRSATTTAWRAKKQGGNEFVFRKIDNDNFRVWRAK